MRCTDLPCPTGREQPTTSAHRIVANRRSTHFIALTASHERLQISNSVAMRHVIPDRPARDQQFVRKAARFSVSLSQSGTSRTCRMPSHLSEIGVEQPKPDLRRTAESDPFLTLISNFPDVIVDRSTLKIWDTKENNE